MALVEIWTIPLERPTLDRIIAVARTRKSFRVLRRQFGVVTLRGKPVPELDNYELEPTDDIDLLWHGAVADGDRLIEFLRIKESLRGEVKVCTAKLDVNESGRRPAEGHYDTWLSFGDDFFGPFISLNIGSSSIGCKDYAYRQRLFQRFLTAIGAAGRVDAVTVTEGALDFQIAQDGVVEFKDFPAESHRRMLEEGGLVIRVGGRVNPSGITVWDRRRDPIAAILAAVTTLGAERVAGGEVRVNCVRQRYEKVSSILAKSKFSPWEASFCGRSRYDLNSLSDALTEMESFILLAFSIKERGTGTVYAEICNDDGQLTLRFYAEPRRGPQEELLCALITDLASGEDIIDHEMG